MINHHTIFFSKLYNNKRSLKKCIFEIHLKNKKNYIKSEIRLTKTVNNYKIENYIQFLLNL